MIIVNEDLKPETFVLNTNESHSYSMILQNVFFAKGFMLASEGHMLLYSRVKMDAGDEYTLISKEQYKLARIASKGHAGVHFVIRDDEIAFADESTSPRIEYDKKKLAEFAKMCANLINFAKSRLGGTKSLMIVNKDYFRKCLDAFGKNTKVKFLFGQTTFDPVIIKPDDFDEDLKAFALLLGFSDSTGTDEVRSEYQKARDDFYEKCKPKEEVKPETKKRKKK